MRHPLWTQGSPDPTIMVGKSNSLKGHYPFLPRRGGGDFTFSQRQNNNIVSRVLNIAQGLNPPPYSRQRSAAQRAVILRGNSGSGNTFTTHNIMFDWASGELYKEVSNVFSG